MAAYKVICAWCKHYRADATATSRRMQHRCQYAVDVMDYVTGKVVATERDWPCDDRNHDGECGFYERKSEVRALE